MKILIIALLLTGCSTALGSRDFLELEVGDCLSFKNAYNFKPAMKIIAIDQSRITVEMLESKDPTIRTMGKNLSANYYLKIACPKTKEESK